MQVIASRLLRFMWRIRSLFLSIAFSFEGKSYQQRCTQPQKKKVSLSFTGIHPEIVDLKCLYLKNSEIRFLEFRRRTSLWTLKVSCCGSPFRIFTLLLLLNAEKTSIQWFWYHFSTTFFHQVKNCCSAKFMAQKQQCFSLMQVAED
jgi:hypothetical protein